MNSCKNVLLLNILVIVFIDDNDEINYNIKTPKI